MKIEAAIVELQGVRLALAFVDAGWVRPGHGDDLIARLGPRLPPLPIMLVADDGRLHAPFQTAVFAPLVRLRQAAFDRFTIDLDTALPSAAPPF